MKCRVCREPAVIDVRRHNANFCRDHFLRLCRDQVATAIEDFEMFARSAVLDISDPFLEALWDAYENEAIPSPLTLAAVSKAAALSLSWRGPKNL